MQDIDYILKRHKAFWDMEDVKKPLMRVGRYSPMGGGWSFPLADGTMAEDGMYLEPDMIDPHRFIGKRNGAVNPISGDFIAGAGIPGFCWMEAIMGCPIQISIGSIWSEPFLEDLGDVEKIKPSDDNPWFKKLLDFTRLLAEREGEDGYPIVQPLLRGPIDIAAAVLGDEQTCMAIYDYPDELRRLLEIGADVFIEVVQARLALTPKFCDGYLSSYGIWAPGKVARTQADNAALVSPQTYREFLLPYDEQIFESFDYPLIHLHSGCLHIADVLLSAEKLRAIQVSLDYPAGPPVSEVLPILKRINEQKPLIITGAVTEKELEQLQETFSPRGLCMSVSIRE